MIFDAISLKSKELDRLIIEKLIPPREDIQELLDSIIFVTQNYNYNSIKLEDLYLYFRKWSTLINIYYPGSYHKSIDKSSSFFCNIDRYDFTNVKKLLIKHTEEYVSHKNFDILTSLINPYFQVPLEQLSKLDKEFTAKYTTLEVINRAIKEFKLCNLIEAEKLNLEALENLRQNNSLNNLQLYFCSWALHNLGNIELVKSNYKKASYYYFDSLKLKNQIDILPAILIYATRLKYLTSQIFEQKSDEYYSEVKSFYLELTNNVDVEKENPVWFKNIIIDTLFILAKILFYKGDFESSNKYIDISINNGIEVNDKIGILKGHILKLFITKHPEIEIINIDKSIKLMNTKNKLSPYFVSILSDTNINEWRLINTTLCTNLLNTFKNNGIVKEKSALLHFINQN